MTTWAEDVKALIDALGDTPTPNEARRITDRYEDTDVQAAIIAKIGEAGSGGGGGDGGLTATVPVTSSEVLACFTTPVELIPAPGADKTIIPTDIAVQAVGATVAYFFAATVNIGPLNTAWANGLDAQLTTDADTLGIYRTAPTFFTDLGNITDEAVVLYADAENPTSGDADLVITIKYYVLDLEAP